MKTFYLLPFLWMLPLTVLAQSVGDAAPDFSATTIDGTDLSLSDLEGTVVILDFWASWCGPCREELPFLAELYESERDKGFEVLAINVDSEPEAMKTFIDGLDFELVFPVIGDAKGELPALYDIPAMPTAVFIDRHGTVRYIHAGFRTSHENKYRSELMMLLEESE